jgi:endonuclease III
VNSSNSGCWPGSTQPDGLRMRATLTEAVPLFTRPTNSSIRFGLLPAAWITEGASISLAIEPQSTTASSTQWGGRLLSLPSGNYDISMTRDRRRISLRDVVAALEAFYGRAKPPLRTKWFELVLLENVAYLVDDARRAKAFQRLKREIGTSPEAILRCDAGTIAAVIADGGMKPMMRAEKVRQCAEIALSIGTRDLDLAMKTDPAHAKRLLRRFPSVGEPCADKILLFCGGVASLAPDSNALRVLTRLGFVEEKRTYQATYRAAVAVPRGDVPTVADAQSAHLLLRRHGQEICKRSSPRCDMCVVRGECAWYRRFSSA